ncbi:outer membrane protein assembly factor BamC [Vibrio sp. SM6]|uniref:Outer membrane protein assembly factor BamC n=1 Tax=Vibrio agarilyticus TaxID=2726741 RepID=A0A7X8TRD2_9VIBR|nr:outer membrane protein assembly factor BamC [Vibrio agarilyticus]NLS13202.1 outer membrane protein assembly factor BamC [Vibrio agarilyticus]
MKFSHQLALSSLAVLVLSGCAGNESQRRQARDDFTYLNTPALETWQVPQGAQPQFYPDYQIPQGAFAGGVGPEVDIRPPQQVLALVPGARYERVNGDVVIWLSDQNRVDALWQDLQAVMDQTNVPYTEVANNTIETDWMTVSDESEDNAASARYAMKQIESGSNQGLVISLLEWRDADGNSVPPSFTEKERQSVFLTNLLTSRYDENKRVEAQRLAQERIKHIPIYMSTDRTGLPVIVARAPYDIVWERLPKVLPEFGLVVEERNQSQGTIVVNYTPPDDEYWQSLGTEPLDFTRKAHTLQLGDLGNRTSISVVDADGKLVKPELLTRLENILRKQLQ